MQNIGTTNPDEAAVSVDIGDNEGTGEESTHNPPAEHSSSNEVNSICRNKVLCASAIFFLLGGVIGGLIGWIIADGKKENEYVNGQKLTEIEETLEDLITNQGYDTDAKDSDGNETTNNPSMPTIEPPPGMNRAEVISLLANKSPDGGAALNDPESPQSNAVNWLWEEIEAGSQYSEMQMIQRYALATLYYCTTGEGWSNDLGFLSSDSECSWKVSDGYIPTWYGKMRRLYTGENDSACNDIGSITSLSIRNNDLSGTIPNELSLLSDLEMFQFRGEGSLAGRIPTELGVLTKLQQFAITDTQIIGPIPSELGQMRLLDWLDLSNNFLTGNIPIELGQLISLQTLDIHNNKGINGQVSSDLSGMKNASECV